MNYKIKENEIYHNDKCIMKLKNRLKKIIELNDTMIVLFDRDTMKDTIYNVQAINKISKEIVWTISDVVYKEHRFEFNYPFVDIYKLDESNFRVFNWDGKKYDFTENGWYLINNPNALIDGKRPW